VKYGPWKALRDMTIIVLVVSLAAYITDRTLAVAGIVLAALASLILYVARSKRQQS
jgi:hypothetical protein